MLFQHHKAKFQLNKLYTFAKNSLTLYMKKLLLLAVCFNLSLQSYSQGIDLFTPDNPYYEIEAFAPGKSYPYDIGEKDIFYHKSDSIFVFNTVRIEPSKSKRKGLRLKFTFIDKVGNEIICDDTDIKKLIPKLECKGEMLYPELLSEEFNRFGVQYRGWRDEYAIKKSTTMPSEYNDALDRVYRAQLVNNCLEPTKWEFVLDSEDYSDFTERKKSDNYLNQRRILAHSWFNVPMDFYKKLMLYYNPDLDINMVDMSYEELSHKSENIKINFESLRGPIDKELDVEILEIGHQSKRKITILDPEEYYKKQFGLILSEKSYTYASILDEELPLTRFQDRGFYNAENQSPFYVQWLKYVDDVKISTIKMNDSEVIIEIRLTGEYSPYEIVIGNVDLAIMNEQILCGFLFGVNTFITNVRNNSRPNTINYDPTQYPKHRKPYLYLIDKKTGKWVNNQYKGVEKFYISFEDITYEKVNIHVLSYERIIPVWMAQIKLPGDFVEKLRVRRRLFNY